MITDHNVRKLRKSIEMDLGNPCNNRNEDASKINSGIYYNCNENIVNNNNVNSNDIDYNMNNGYKKQLRFIYIYIMSLKYLSRKWKI